jgi:hypothetical protein
MNEEFDLDSKQLDERSQLEYQLQQIRKIAQSLEGCLGANSFIDELDTLAHEFMHAATPDLINRVEKLAHQADRLVDRSVKNLDELAQKLSDRQEVAQLIQQMNALAHQLRSSQPQPVWMNITIEQVVEYFRSTMVSLSVDPKWFDEEKTDFQKLLWNISLLKVVGHLLQVILMSLPASIRSRLSCLRFITSFADRVLYLQGGRLSQWLSGCLKEDWAAILLALPQHLRNKHRQSGLQVLWGVATGFLGIVIGEFRILLSGESNEDELVAKSEVVLAGCSM